MHECPNIEHIIFVDQYIFSFSFYFFCLLSVFSLEQNGREEKKKKTQIIWRIWKNAESILLKTKTNMANERRRKK